MKKKIVFFYGLIFLSNLLLVGCEEEKQAEKKEEKKEVTYKQEQPEHKTEYKWW